MLHIGVDLGGTGIKAGVADGQGTLLHTDSLPTRLPRSAGAVCDDILALIDTVRRDSGAAWDQIEDIGVGCPGTCNTQTGVVAFATNLKWRDFPLRQYLKERLPADIPVYIANDANAAALGEYAAGSAKGADSAVVITLGTGLGGGAILHNRMIEGHFSAGGEFGHMVIAYGGKPCSCGRRGCFEAYASATGLINLTRDALAVSPDSLMHRLVEAGGKVSGKTAFAAMKQGDKAAAQVIDRFIGYLACGVANIINALQPQVLSIGGGISREGDALLLPLKEKVPPEVYGGAGVPQTELRICTLGNDAGMIGAAMLGRVQ
jgi:glucokinase